MDRLRWGILSLDEAYHYFDGRDTMSQRMIHLFVMSV
jgi:hypothetical protein